MRRAAGLPIGSQGQFTFLPAKRTALGRLVKGAKSKLSLARFFSLFPKEKPGSGDSLLFTPRASSREIQLFQGKKVNCPQPPARPRFAVAAPACAWRAACLPIVSCQARQSAFSQNVMVSGHLVCTGSIK